jgi:archaellum component FlaF (FlaF/FlaG flagellin family)
MEEKLMISNRFGGARSAVVLLSSAAIVVGTLFVGAGPASATVAPAVAVTKLSVTKGSDSGGTAVHITGKGFTTWTPVAADVVFNGTATTSAPIVLSDTQMAVVAPAKGSGTATGNVIISDSVGGGSPAFAPTLAVTATAWAYITPLALTALPATLLNPLGGTVLPVDVGSGSLGASQVALDALKITATVGGVAAKVKWVTTTTGTVTVPAGASSASFTKICLLSNGVSDSGSCDSTHAKYATVISKISVATAPLAGIAGAAALTITGKGLAGATPTTPAVVTLGGATLTCVSVAATSDTKLTCNIPAHVVGVVSIVVTPTTATFGTTAASAFTYTDV